MNALKHSLFFVFLFFTNTLLAQSFTYNRSSGNFFGGEVQENGNILLTMSIESSARNMCEDFKGIMKKDAKGNFKCYIYDDGDEKNVIVAFIKSKNDLINGAPKKIEVKTTNNNPCDVPKGKYEYNELGD